MGGLLMGAFVWQYMSGMNDIRKQKWKADKKELKAAAAINPKIKIGIGNVFR